MTTLAYVRVQPFGVAGSLQLLLRNLIAKACSIIERWGKGKNCRLSSSKVGKNAPVLRMTICVANQCVKRKYCAPPISFPADPQGSTYEDIRSSAVRALLAGTAAPHQINGMYKPSRVSLAGVTIKKLDQGTDLPSMFVYS